MSSPPAMVEAELVVKLLVSSWPYWIPSWWEFKGPGHGLVRVRAEVPTRALLACVGIGPHFLL